MARISYRLDLLRLNMVNSGSLLSLPSDGKSLSFGGLGVIYRVMPEDTGGALAVVEHPIEPGRLVRPHTHSNEDEISYVVEGEIGVRIGDKEFSAGPGTWIFKPRAVPHTFWNASPKGARLIEIITPGAFAHCFEELAAILSSGGPPDLGRLTNLHQKYGQTYSEEWIPSLREKYALKLVGE